MLVLGAGAVLIAFVWLVARFWHPAYGFTKFIQADSSDEAVAIHEFRDAAPVFFYEGNNGYDGGTYAQIAFDPLLESPELPTAVGVLPYRARRILGSWMAWGLSLGQPERIAHVYAALNIGVWFFFAAVMWRLLAVRDAYSWCAWAPLVFSAGALHSVRLALTDLLSTTLLAGAMLLHERGKSRGALGLLALAGLARETTLGAVAGLWRGPWFSASVWRANLAKALLVALPLTAWMLYILWKIGPASQGIGNFSWPVGGLVDKWVSTFRDFGRHPDFTWLIATTLLATFALTAQAIYLLICRRVEDPWWRIGLFEVVMLLWLGTPVWEGNPGAATRVLLPMGVAFAVLTVRQRSGWLWLIAGNLTVFSGVLALWHVPHDARDLREFSAGSSWIIQVGPGWYPREEAKHHTWTWSTQGGALDVDTWPRSGAPVTVRLGLRAPSPREVEVRAADRVLWHGEIGAINHFITVSGVPRGHTRLEIHTAAPPVRESPNSDARQLGVAVTDPRVN